MPERADSSKLRAYLELLRISNVLTAVADVWMGMVVASGHLQPLGVLTALSLASVGIYLGGMVLNDVLDIEHDQQLRTTRPIPSGRVSRRAAGRLAAALISAGIACAGVAAWLLSSFAPLIIGGLLAGMVVAYDASPKAAVWRPPLMGACRGLNVLLGMSALGTLGFPVGWILISVGILLYVLGVTIFARTEEQASRRSSLAVGAVIAVSGVALMAALPFLNVGMGDATLRVTEAAWLLLWAVLAMLIARRFAAAVLQPTPRHVQSAVGHAIQSIILLDAALAWGYGGLDRGGQFCGFAVLALWPLTMLTARFIPQT